MIDELQKAIWAGDLDALDRLAGCVCCCAEHTFEGCPARTWHGCRGQESLTRDDERAWADHYAKHHGLSAAKFYGEE